MADLRHLGKEAGRRRVAELLERFDLVDDAAKPAMTYSGGMRRRLDLAMTLVGDPRIIFLDEPTTGLDPRSRRVMWEIVRELVAGGVTIFLTTQYLEEADRLADRIARARRRPRRRRGHAGRAQAARPRRPASGSSSPTRPSSTGRPRRSTARTRDDEALDAPAAERRRRRLAAALLDRLDANAIEVGALSVQTPDLDDVFLSLTGRTTTSTKAMQPDDRLPSSYRLGDHAPAEPPPDAPLPIADVLHRRHPVVFLLLFVYVFGGTLGRAVLGGCRPPAVAPTYLAYVVPGILIITVAGAATGTAISVAMDMTEGIIARFRTMAIARASVLAGHVLGSVIQTMLAIGDRVRRSPCSSGSGRRRVRSSGLAAAGLLALTAFADRLARRSRSAW